MQELTVKTNTAGTTTIIGNWELRAGSHDTGEWQTGASDVTYPGGGPGTFRAENSDGTTGYDPAPKMALLSMVQASNSVIAVLEGGDITAVHALFGQQASGTGGTSDVVLSASAIADSDSDDINEVTITGTSVGGTATATLQVMMLYS